MTEVWVEGDGPAYALSGLRLTGVRARERERGALDERALQDAFERQRDLIAAFASDFDPATRTYDLRTIVSPSPEEPARATVSIFLLLRAEGQTPSEAVVAAEKAVTDLVALLRGVGSAYDFLPIGSADELSYALQPFRFSHAAEIRRREALYYAGTLEARAARPIGFGQVGEAASGEQPLYHVHPLVARPRNLDGLYDVLLAQPAPLVLSAQLRSAPLTAPQRGALESTISLAERWLERSDTAAHATQPRAARRLAQALAEVKLNHLARLADAAFAVSLRILSPLPLRAAVVEAWAQCMTDPAGAHNQLSLSGGTQCIALDEERLTQARSALATLDMDPPRSDVAVAEAASLLGLYDLFEAQAAFRLPVPDVEELPGVVTRFARFVPPPREVPALGASLGVSTDTGQPIRLQTDDRRRHCYVVGQSGTGKSTLFLSMILEDIRQGHGVCVIDPHGDLVEDILRRYPKSRADDLVLFDAGDRERPIGLNLLEWSTEDEQHFIVQEVLAMMYKLFPPSYIGPIFERVLRNALLTLMANPEALPSTLLEVPRLYSNREFHKRYLPHVKDPQVRAYWTEEFASSSDHTRSEMMGYITSKYERFVADPVMRNIIGQQRSSIRFDEIMNTSKVLLVDLGKGSIGELNSSLLGMTIMTKLQAGAMARAQLAQDARRDFFLYVDEFQNFATPTFAALLSEARKFRLNLVLTNQYMSQIRDHESSGNVLSAVLGNVGTLIAMRVGIEDAPILERYFAPVFRASDLLALPNWHAYVNLLVDGQRVRPFSMRTVADDAPADERLGNAIRQLSRLKFGRERTLVEEEISARWR
jgi:hypothetical protein